ncbi:MAG: hypothetical protein ABI112_07920 [Terracoccus sp.]
MPTAGPYDAAPTAVLRVYLQQRRVDRLRAARRLARWLTIALALVLVTMAVMHGPAVLGATTAAFALVVSLAAWVVAMVNDHRVHSGRLDSRICLARIDAVRRQLAVQAPPTRRENAGSRRTGANVLTGGDVHALHSQVRQLEHEIDDSEQRVERALLVGAMAAALGAAALGAAVGASALSIS